jgi:hypothetical protein
LRSNCHLKHLIKGKIEAGVEATERQGSRRKQLLNDFKGKREYLKEETIDGAPWRTRSRRGVESLVGQTRQLIIYVYTIKNL